MTNGRHIFFSNNHGTSADVKVGDIDNDDRYMTAAVGDITSAASLESGAATRMEGVTAYTGGDAGENEYIVRATITTVGTDATTGDLWMWLDYRFDPNVAYS